MKNVWVVLISLFSAIILAGAIFFFVGYFKPKPGGVLVETSSTASVYVNGSFVGKTPYSGVYSQTSISLKIVPDDTEAGLLPFETKLNLSPGVQTVVRREFAKTEDESSGDIISFEKESGKTSMVVISSPDNSQISVDGVPRGFSPYKTTTISPAQHQITVKSPGFSDRIMTVKTLSGYRLTVYAKLGKLKEETPIDNTPTVKTYIEILDTPTGFLRVRTEPGVNGKEIAQVTPGSKYLFLSEDSATGWYEIQYQEPQAGLPNGIVGWVTKEFSKKIEESGEASTPQGQ